MNIGIFGGSFDPVHPGHLAVAIAALHESDLDEVWMMVSPQNPLKTECRLASEADRLEMVRLAISTINDPEASRIFASDYECRLPKPSYTINTLRSLQKDYPDCRFTVIIGEDNLRNFSRWRANDEILRDFGLIVYPRARNVFEINTIEKSNDMMTFPATEEMSATCDKTGPGIVNRLKRVKLYPVSSTQIRALASAKCNYEELAKLTFPEVADYIIRKGLYR